jgi:hypothetical protein
LGDPGHSIDLTPQSERAKVCGLNANAKDSSGCNQMYFIAGENAFVMPELIVDASSPNADIILASDHRGYLLNFMPEIRLQTSIQRETVAHILHDILALRLVQFVYVWGIPVLTNLKLVSWSSIQVSSRPK